MENLWVGSSISPFLLYQKSECLHTGLVDRAASLKPFGYHFFGRALAFLVHNWVNDQLRAVDLFHNFLFRRAFFTFLRRTFLWLFFAFVFLLLRFVFAAVPIYFIWSWLFLVISLLNPEGGIRLFFLITLAGLAVQLIGPCSSLDQYFLQGVWTCSCIFHEASQQLEFGVRLRPPISPVLDKSMLTWHLIRSLFVWELSPVTAHVSVV